MEGQDGTSHSPGTFQPAETKSEVDAIKNGCKDLLQQTDTPCNFTDTASLVAEAEDYGQREPLTRRIRTLLKDYPDGLPVPKELIQNADDASATQTCLLLDLRSHTSEKLIKPVLAQFQGPALVFYNNKPFLESDFINLCEFGGETKLENREKIGKFGLGFNSVYNLTDMPMFVSQTSFCVLDPHQKFFDGRRGLRFNLQKKNSDGNYTADLISGQLEPFEGLFGFSANSVKIRTGFTGTIFRFPLRTTEHAAWSDIRKNEYSIGDANQLIQMTIQTAELYLLFIQFVKELKICVWKNGEPKMEYLLTLAKSFGSTSDATVTQVLFGDDDSFCRSFSLSIRDEKALNSKEWSICVVAPGSKSKEGTRSIGAIAFPSDDLNLSSYTKSRKLFCFLPLPVPIDTGLPFLVNGTFAVTSSRRYLEYSTGDERSTETTGDGEWNRDVLELAVTPSLCRSALEKCQTHSQAHLFNLFPDVELVSDPFCRIIVETFYDKIANDRNMQVLSSLSHEHGFFALADPNVLVLSNEIPKQVQKSIAKCLGILLPNQVWLTLPEKITKSIGAFQPEAINSKTKDFVHVFIVLMLRHETVWRKSKAVQEHCLSVVKYALDNFTSNATVVELLRSCPWIQTDLEDIHGGFVMKKPCDVVDPTSPIAKMLYFNRCHFPCDGMDLSEQNIKFMCNHLNMCCKFLPTAAISDVEINLNSISETRTWKERIAQYFNHLNSCGHHYENLSQGLCKRMTILVASQSDVSAKRLPPAEVFPTEMKELLQYIRPLYDFKQLDVHQGSFVDRIMRLYKQPTITDVLSNLQAMVADRNKHYKTKVDDQVAILEYLANHSSRPPDISKIQNILKAELVLASENENQFCKIGQVCLGDCPVLDGKLYKLNVLIARNPKVSEFLRRLGLPNMFSNQKYCKIVEKLELIPSDRQMNQLRNILEFLKDKLIKVNKLPDEEMKMRNTKDICLNDFELRFSISDSPPLKHCHPSLSHDLARYFGVKSKRSMILSLNSELVFENFLQREDLTKRLSRIAKSYSNPMDMFKELIQNADDASATEIHFILDKRVLSKERVVDYHWEKLVEPALLVFNDAHFTSSDIKGIQALGAGSKGDSVQKIGQFGVGFNCVYSITDTPCFLTQVDKEGAGNLCVLDPTFQVTTGGGIKLNLNQSLLVNFPDTFGCFLKEIEGLDATAGKTMFRFPLRKENTELGPRSPDLKEMRTKLDEFVNVFHDYVLFLRHIQKIKVSEIESDVEPVPKLLASISKTVVSNKDQYEDYIRRQLQCQSETNEDSVVYGVKITSDNGSTERMWLISDFTGCSKPLPNMVKNARRSGDIKVKKHAAVALPSDWYKTQKDPAIFCYLPIEEASTSLQKDNINIPVVINGQFFLDESRRMISVANQEVRGCWNQYILENVVGRAYAKLVAHLKEKNLTFHAYLNSLPKFKTLPVHSDPDQHPSVASLVTRGLMDSLKGTNWLPIVTSDKTVQLYLTANEVLNFTGQQDHVSSLEQHIVLYDLSLRFDLKLTQLPSTYIELWRNCGTEIIGLKPSHLIECLGQFEFPQPVKIEETLFRRSADLVIFLEWASRELTAHKNPKSLPLFLSAGGFLQKNTGEKLYSSSFSIHEIFPAISDKVLDPHVEKVLHALKITCVMTLGEFLVYFKQYFPEFCEGRSFNMEPGNEQWLRLTWDFLASHQKKVRDHPCFENLSIILCENRKDKNFLLPISEGTKCVLEQHRKLTLGSVEIKTKQFLGVYQLSYKLFRSDRNTERASFARQLVMGSELSQSQQVHLLHVIDKNNTRDSFDTFSKKQLYKYFRDSFCARNNCLTPSDFQKLRTLPIFEVLPSAVESLEDGSSSVSSLFTVYSVPVELPLDGLNLVRSLADKFVRAEKDSAGLEFQKNLGIVSQTIPQIYVERIIPLLFNRFEWKDLDKHLKFLQNQELPKKENWERDALFKCLGDVEFIQIENGTFAKPSMLFDPDCFLYKKFKTELLLPQKFHHLKPLLKDCGLSCQVTREEFWSFTGCHAAEILNETQVTKDQLKIFKELLDTIIGLKLEESEFGRFQSLAIFQTLSHGLKPLNETFRFPHCTLVRHVAPILSESYDQALELYIKPRSRNYLAKFYSKTPPLHKVVENLRVLLQQDTHNENAVLKCVDFVFKNMGNNSQIKKQLSSLPFVSSSIECPSRRLTPKMTCKRFKCDVCPEVNVDLSRPGEHSTSSDCPLNKYIKEPSDSFLGRWNFLKQLGATDEISLQQIVYALAKFGEEMSASKLWTENPNMKKKFGRLEEHLFSKFQTESKSMQNAIEGLEKDCPIYAEFEDGQLKRINEGIIIDKAGLFKKIAASNGQNKPLLPCSEIVKNSSRHEENFTLLKKLPIALKPRFFTEVIQCKIDESTFDEANIVDEQLRIKEVSAKLSSDQFLDKVVHVIKFFGESNLNVMGEPTFSVHQEKRKKASVADLAALQLLRLRAVRKLWFRFQLKRSQETVTDRYEESFHVEVNKQIIFACPFLEEVSTGCQFDDHYNKKRKHVLITVTNWMFTHIEFFLDSREIEFLSQLLFDYHTEEEQAQAMKKAGFPPLTCAPNYEIIGETVPFSFHALLEYDPRKRFTKGEIVAVERDKAPLDGDIHMYTYGLFEETEDEGDLNGITCIFPTFRIKTTLARSESISGTFVFAFKENLEEISGSKTEERGVCEVNVDDQMEKDIEQIKQIVWVVARGSEGQASMDEIQKRLLSSVLRKYTEPDRQETLRRVLEEALEIEAAKRPAVETTEDDNGSRKTTPRTTTTRTTTPDTEQIINRFVEQHFTRMNNEINFYKVQCSKRINSRARQNTNADVETINSQLSHHLEVVRSVEPHPVLAKLWLKQASDDLSHLSRIWDPESVDPSSSWAADVTLKVAENCLVSLLLMKDGKTELPFLTDSRKSSADPTGTLKELIEKVETSCQEDMRNLKQALATVRLSELHRPNQGQMLISRSTIAVAPLNSLVQIVQLLHSKVTALIG